MSTSLNIEDLLPLSQSDRKKLIQSQAESIKAFHITDEDEKVQKALRWSYQVTKAIKPLLFDYFQHQINSKSSVVNLEEQSAAICKETDKFAKDFIEKISTTNKLI